VERIFRQKKGKVFGKMKKIIAFATSLLICIAAVGIEYVNIPFSRAASLTNNAVFIAVRWVPVGMNRDGTYLESGKIFPWQRRGEQVWGRSGYPMPRSGAPRPATVATSSNPLFYTEIYLKIQASGGSSQESDHYFVVLDDSAQIWFDKDGYFNDSRESNLPPERCSNAYKRVDPISSNNTFGPYKVGDYIHFDYSKGYMFSPQGSIGTPFSDRNDFSGRVFKLGEAILGKDGTRVLLMSEVLFASCEELSYNLSVESDLWYGINPSATAARLYSMNGDVPPNAQVVQRSTVLDPTGTMFFAPATTFHNIKLKYREYIGVEIWKDDGVNVNLYGGGGATPNNLSDDYQVGRCGEEFLGMKSGESDTDSYLSLSLFPPTFRFYSSGATQFGCGATIYNDLDGSLNVSSGDIRLNSITVTVGDTVITYDAGTIVADGDADLGFPLNNFVNERFYDFNENNEYNDGDFIYKDANVDGRVTNGDVRLSRVVYRGRTYECGSRVTIGDLWLFENPVSGITVGKCGDFRFMDIEIIPSAIPLNAKVNPPLKVEQTSQIDVNIYPPLRSGEVAYIVLHTSSGSEIVREVRDVVSTYSFTYTPFNGSCNYLGKIDPLIIEVYRNLDITNDSVGPRDGVFGYWSVETSSSIPQFKDKYDCRSFDVLKVLPEDLKGRTNITCLSNISSRYPNLVLKLFDADNPNDVNDPANIPVSTTSSRAIIANYNATGAGISYIFTAKDSSGTKYIVQVNNDSTYLIWKWIDNPHPTSGKGYFGALDFEDDVSGPYSSVNNNPLYGGSFSDKDCSGDSLECDICRSGSIPPIGKITEGDTFGIFDGTLGTILNDGVWVYVTPYGEGIIGRDGGEIPIAVWPGSQGSSLILRVFTYNALFDYNSVIQHPPYFITDNSKDIDYCGLITIGWKSEEPPPPPEPPEEPPGGGGSGSDGVVFSEFVVVDQGLRYSKVPYTSNISPDYDPTLRHLIRDFRCYPGGQTQTGRAGGIQREGRNSYPAIWENQFTKLGTEFFPLTDYGIFFVLRDSQDGGLIHFEATDRSHKITSIEITGPFMVPYFPLSHKYYGGLYNIPISYDYSGEIIIDSSNYKEYELIGADWTKVINPGKSERVTYSEANSYLSFSRRLNYTGIPRVIVIDEIIPINYGKISIKVNLADGRSASYWDCCDVPMEGIPVHALEIGGFSGGIEIGADSIFSVTIKEHEPIQTVKPTNDAVVVIWQDRGIKTQAGGDLKGAGDGWITGAPESSATSGYFSAYTPYDDLNGDGKISFNDWETEIVGSYDLATNTWAGGLVDARTYQVNNGKYTFRLTAANNSLIDTIGVDFNNNHLIDDDEILPLLVTAYKYGDDNNDRGFSPMYMSPIDGKSFSHEVYITGQAIVPIGFSGGPEKNLKIEVTPKVLTAGVSPEVPFRGEPLTFKITYDDGSPVDLTNSGRLSTKEVAALFADDIPLTLPEYYWVRTDLHNEASDGISNEGLFNAKNLISYDFSEAKKGIYKFKNFVANDSGSFKVRVTTPDGRSFGSVDLVVKNPKIEYTVLSLDGAEIKDIKTSNIYKVKAKVLDAEDNLLIGKGLNFLPYITIPGELKEFSYFIGLDKDNSGKISENEVLKLSDYYITKIDSDKRKLNKPDWFGAGAIYNKPYEGYYLLPDMNGDGKINYKDALSTTNGEVEFYIFATDPVLIGGLVGFNNIILDEKLSDVAGGKPTDNGSSIKRRYVPDGKFGVDWFGFSTQTVPITGFGLDIRDSKGSPLTSKYFNSSNPDLTCWADNEVQVKAIDVKNYLKNITVMEDRKELSRVELSESFEGEISIKPSSVGEGVIKLYPIYDFGIPNMKEISGNVPVKVLDSVAGIKLSILKGKYLFTGLNEEVLIKASYTSGDVGKDLSIKLKGSGIDLTEKTDELGLSLFSFTPKKEGEIDIIVDGDYILLESPKIQVFDSDALPLLELSSYPERTNKKEIEILGRTLPRCKVYLDSTLVAVNENGEFKLNLFLKEGENKFVVKAINPKGTANSKNITITLILEGPKIEVDEFPSNLYEISSFTVKGKVTPADANVFVNDIPANVSYGIFSATIPVNIGINRVIIRAIDEFGNETVLEKELKVYRRILILLTIGKDVMMVNGKSVELDSEPFIMNSRTMVPLRAIAEAFGAEVKWLDRTQTVEIELEGVFISMQIGNKVAMVGSKVYILDAPPVIRKSRTFVPIRFIAEGFGSKVDWDPVNYTVLIERLSLK
jgi:hypothetical protein